MTTPENTGAIQDTKFKPGQSGNPAGKPKGTRHRITRAIQELLDGEAETITRQAIEAAKAGDMTAIRLVLERVAPVRKDNPVSIQLPDISSSSDASQAMAAILNAVANGEITPSEGTEVAKLMDCYLRAVEATEFEERLNKLEERSPK